MKKIRFCDFIKEARFKSGKTLRLFCNDNNLDVTYISKLERGTIPVPDDLEFLNKYAKLLNLEGVDVIRFYDIAEEEKGKIYCDMSDDKVLVKCLPLWIGKMDKGKFAKFVEELRKT